MIYEFLCPRCNEVYEEFLTYQERKTKVPCPYCGLESQKVISLPNTHKDLLYNFVDVNTTGKPVPIHSKGQWKKHLKSIGQTDDIPQGPLKHNELKPMKKEKTKEDRRKEYKSVVENVLREGGKIR
jgi:putative FmdB family regulatory protein